MYLIDKDKSDLISITELSNDEAIMIQIAIITLADQLPDDPNAPLLRRMAMILDKFLTK